MNKHVYIRPAPKLGRRGDRDTERHLYYDYEVYVVPADVDNPIPAHPPADALVHTVSGYDSFHSTIRPGAHTRGEAEAYAERLAKVMGGEVIIGEYKRSWRVACEKMIVAESEDEAKSEFNRLYMAGEVYIGTREIKS